MAEKQYKNYDERFLKEESSAIEYSPGDFEEDVFEYTSDDSQYHMLVIKMKNENGEYVQTKDELYRLFLRHSIIVMSDSPFSDAFFPIYYSSDRELISSASYAVIAYMGEYQMFAMCESDFEKFKSNNSKS